MSEKDQRAAALLHHRADTIRKGDPLAPPIVQASVFYLPGDPDMPGDNQAGHQYGRFGHPTWEAVEAQHAILEDAPSAVFPSGMAAIAALFYATLKTGDKIITPADGYYTTGALAERFLTPLGVKVIAHPIADYENAPLEDAALVFLETPSNPGLDVCDISAVARRTKAAGVLLVVDNTTMTPYAQRPLDLGADVIVAADTKAPGGHGDALLGHVSTRDENLMQAVRDWRRMAGAIPGAMDAWLVHRGLETLEVRLARMSASAQSIAERFQDHKAVDSIRYPGLETDPSHTIARQQMDSFGFLIGLTLKDKTTAEKFLQNCPLIAQTTSFGSAHTSGERRARWGDAVAEGFIRLSVGLEPVETLWAALNETLTEISENRRS